MADVESAPVEVRRPPLAPPRSDRRDVLGTLRAVPTIVSPSSRHPCTAVTQLCRTAVFFSVRAWHAHGIVFFLPLARKARWRDEALGRVPRPWRSPRLTRRRRVSLASRPSRPSFLFSFFLLSQDASHDGRTERTTMGRSPSPHAAPIQGWADVEEEPVSPDSPTHRSHAQEARTHARRCTAVHSPPTRRTFSTRRTHGGC